MTFTQFYYHEILKDGTHWVSPPFPETREGRNAIQGVIAGHCGNARWAATPEGEFIYGLDASGQPLARAPLPGGVR